MLLAVVGWLSLVSPVSANESQYRTAGELTTIGAASVAIWQLGHHLRQRNANAQPRWVKPFGFDERISRFLGRKPGLGRQNLVDSDFGSVATVIGAGMMILAVDRAHPANNRSQDIWQNQFMYVSGALTTKGVTDAFKGLVARQRPLIFFAPDLAAQRKKQNQASDHESFFSGHASSAFYAMTFLNKRIRTAMRQEMTPDAYRNRRWLPSTLCYGWASFIALSRIQAYKHYLTDVTAGALAGWLIGELYYSLSRTNRPATGSDPTPLLFEIQFKF